MLCFTLEHPGFSGNFLRSSMMIERINQPSILRLKQVISRTGLSRSTIYVLMSENSFPKQLKLGAHAVGWIESEIDEWINLRIQVGRKAA